MRQKIQKRIEIQIISNINNSGLLFHSNNLDAFRARRVRKSQFKFFHRSNILLHYGLLIKALKKFFLYKWTTCVEAMD